MTRWFWICGLLNLAVVQTTTQQPTFRSRVDLVVLNVRAIDRTGAPVTTLRPADFEVTVEGKRREVITAEYQSAGHVFTSVPSGPDDQFASQKSSILLIVDPANLRTETSRATLDGAAAFVQGLPESHDVGLLVMPSGTPSVELGQQRAPIASALKRILGEHNPRNPIPIDEERIRRALHDVIGRMTALDGRRTVIYLADRFLPTLGVLDLARRASLSGVVFYVVTADAPIMTAESINGGTGAGDEIRDGLAGLAVASGGAMLRRIARADGVFDRLARELSGQYLLSFVADASADSGVHAINVRVKQSGVEVHAQRQFVR
jgi:VWFA-related protein